MLDEAAAHGRELPHHLEKILPPESRQLEVIQRGTGRRSYAGRDRIREMISPLVERSAKRSIDLFDRLRGIRGRQRKQTDLAKDRAGTTTEHSNFLLVSSHPDPDMTEPHEIQVSSRVRLDETRPAPE